MEKILNYRIFNKLKSVYRFCSVDNRKESSAEHSWSCLILADYFLSLYNYDLDRLKVYELLMYHDVVEIKAGDSVLHPNIDRSSQKDNEAIAAKHLLGNLPAPLNQKFFDLFKEFEERETKEAKFAKLVDSFEAQIHELDYKEDWKGWTKEFLLNSKLKYFDDFPELRELFLEVSDYLEDEGYFD